MCNMDSLTMHVVSGGGAVVVSPGGDSLRPNKGHVKSASVSSSGTEPAIDPLRSRY